MSSPDTYLFFISDCRQIFCLIKASAHAKAKTASPICSLKSACARFITKSAQVYQPKITRGISIREQYYTSSSPVHLNVDIVYEINSTPSIC